MADTRLCNVKINDLTLEEAVEAALAKREHACFVVTPNAVILEDCRRQSAHARLLNSADLSLPDGKGVVLAARWQGTPLRGRVAGIEFGEALLARATRDGLRVFFLGGGAGVAEEAARRMRLRYKGLCVCGCCGGYFDRTGEEDTIVLGQIQAARPDVLMVCLGFPLQEEWIACHIAQLPGLRVAVGLGGSFDVWAGRARRAPAIVSRMGLEWAWRMALEPKRLKNLPAILRFMLS